MSEFTIDGQVYETDDLDTTQKGLWRFINAHCARKVRRHIFGNC